MVASDTSTLLQVAAAVGLIGGVAFGLATLLVGTTRLASVCWACANLMFGAGVVAVAARGHWHTPLAFGLSNLLLLGGLALVYAGLRVHRGQSLPTRELWLVVAGGGGFIAVAYAAGWPLWRVGVYSVASAWLLVRVAVATWQGLRPDFGPACVAVIAAPPCLGAVMHLARLTHLLVVPDGSADVSVPSAANAIWAWSTLVLLLLMNLSVAAFIGARQLVHIRALTLTDALTGAANRRAIERAVQHHSTAQQRHGMPLAIVYLDLDHFKALNDRHGHGGGDEALRHTVRVVQASCRAGDIVGRLGGEEFCVVLPFTEFAGACLMAERMRAALEGTPMWWNGQTITLSASFGVACATGDDDEPWPELLARADRAMYAAKAAGRNCVSC